MSTAPMASSCANDSVTDAAHGHYVLKSTCASKGGFSKFTTLPPLVMFKRALNSRWVLEQGVSVTVREPGLLLRKKRVWHGVPLVMLPSKSYLLVYIGDKTGYLLRIAGATNLKLLVRKKTPLALDTSASQLTLVYPFGDLKLTFHVDENVWQEWQRVVLASHQADRRRQFSGDIVHELWPSASTLSVNSVVSNAANAKNTDDKNVVMRRVSRPPPPPSPPPESQAPTPLPASAPADLALTSPTLPTIHSHNRTGSGSGSNSDSATTTPRSLSTRSSNTSGVSKLSASVNANAIGGGGGGGLKVWPPANAHTPPTSSKRSQSPSLRSGILSLGEADDRRSLASNTASFRSGFSVGAMQREGSVASSKTQPSPTSVKTDASFKMLPTAEGTPRISSFHFKTLTSPTPPPAGAAARTSSAIVSSSATSTPTRVPVRRPGTTMAGGARAGGTLRASNLMRYWEERSTAAPEVRAPPGEAIAVRRVAFRGCSSAASVPPLPMRPPPPKQSPTRFFATVDEAALYRDEHPMRQE